MSNWVMYLILFAVACVAIVGIAWVLDRHEDFDEDIKEE